MEATAIQTNTANVQEATISLAFIQLDILNKLTPYGLFKLTPIDNL